MQSLPSTVLLSLWGHSVLWITIRNDPVCVTKCPLVVVKEKRINCMIMRCLLNVCERAHTSLGLIILQGHDSRRLFQNRENLLGSSGVSQFVLQTGRTLAPFFKLSCSRLFPLEKTEEIVLLRAEHVSNLTWPNSNRDPWEDLCEIIQNVLTTAKTLLQAEFLFRASLSHKYRNINRMCARHIIFSQIWVTVGRCSSHKERGCHHERRRASGRLVFSSHQRPPEDKTQMNFQKHTMGLPTWCCLRVLEVPRRCEQQGYRPISTKTTQRVDGDKVTVLATSVLTTLEPVKIFSPAPSSGAKHALVSNRESFLLCNHGERIPAMSWTKRGGGQQHSAFFHHS